MAYWLTYRIKVGDDVLVLADEEARELIKNETERSKKADAQTASFLESTTTNGIIRNSKSDPFGQTAIGGMKVVIDKGDLIINGNIKNHTRLTRTYNVTQENRTEVFLYRFDSVTNEITGLWRDCIIQGDIILSREDKTELPLRSSGYYDILICKITIPAGATEITQDMIGDFRQNEYYCGYAKNLLIEIDETLTKSDAAADAAAVGTVISDLRKETRTRDIITEKRLTNLEMGLPADRWAVDDTVAYVKDVPVNALPYAGIDKIGGMTRKCTNLWSFGDCDDTKPVRVATSYPVGTYTLSYQGNADVSKDRLLRITVDFANGGKTGFYGNISERSMHTIEAPDKITEIRFSLVTTVDGTETSERFSCTKIMLNSGDTAMPYEPYFSGLRSAPVTEVDSVGANLFDFDTWKSSVYAARCEVQFGDNEATLTTTGEDGYVVNQNLKIPVVGGKYYSVSLEASGGYVYLFKNGGTEDAIYFSNSFRAFIAPDDAEFYTVRIGVIENGVSCVFKNIMFNRGSTALPYSPYVRNTLAIPEAVQNLDGYGWGINDDCYNYIDWEKKQFVKRVGCVDSGTLNWSFSNEYYTATVLDKAGGRNNLLCDKYDTSAGSGISYLADGEIIGLQSGNSIYIKDKLYTDAATFKAAMSGKMLYYELAEPVVTDISDLLPPDNLIGVEGGGAVTMANEYEYDVPSKITYQLKGVEA